MKEKPMRRLTIKTVVSIICLFLVHSAVQAEPAKAAAAAPTLQQQMMIDVRHQLVMLPYYWVFDDLSFQVDGSTVTLSGYVTRPTLKSSAERVVSRVPGVAKVVNQIEVLPLSPFDDSIRRAVYYAVYGNPGLDRYALQSVPSIHIIVKNGDVTLTGKVLTRMDKSLAEIKARGVFGVFSLTNNLIAEKA
jgi:hyperosmotically inducible periplasmic protein